MTHRSKSHDSYEEGSFQASKTMTVTRMATPRAPSLCRGAGGGYHGGGGNAERRRI